MGGDSIMFPHLPTSPHRVPTTGRDTGFPHLPTFPTAFIGGGKWWGCGTSTPGRTGTRPLHDGEPAFWWTWAAASAEVGT